MEPSLTYNDLLICSQDLTTPRHTVWQGYKSVDGDGFNQVRRLEDNPDHLGAEHPAALSRRDDRPRAHI